MFEKLFGKKSATAARGEDQVWVSGAARLEGLRRDIGAIAEAERSVLVVALTVAALDRLETLLAPLNPVRCADVFAKDALRASLAQPGSVAIAMSGALPLDLSPATGPGVDIHVLGRNDLRAADEGIERFADALGPNAHLVFHISLEDRLLQPFLGSIRPMLEKLGMTAEEPIEHAFVTRAIKNAQDRAGAG